MYGLQNFITFFSSFWETAWGLEVAWAPELSSAIQEYEGKHDPDRERHINNKIVLTGFPTVTIPCSRTMLGWQNWPMMAASCRNLVCSISGASGFNVFTATSTLPPVFCHTPLCTVPKCPEPMLAVTLEEKERWRRRRKRRRTGRRRK